MARQIKIDLTDAADAEIRRLCEVTQLGTPDVFREGMSVYRSIIEGKAHLVGALEAGLMYAKGAKEQGLQAEGDIYDIERALEWARLL